MSAEELQKQGSGISIWLAPEYRLRQDTNAEPVQPRRDVEFYLEEAIFRRFSIVGYPACTVLDNEFDTPQTVLSGWTGNDACSESQLSIVNGPNSRTEAVSVAITQP